MEIYIPMNPNVCAGCQSGCRWHQDILSNGDEKKPEIHTMAIFSKNRGTFLSNYCPGQTKEVSHCERTIGLIEAAKLVTRQ